MLVTVVDITKKGTAKPSEAGVSWIPHNVTDDGGKAYRAGLQLCTQGL